MNKGTQKAKPYRTGLERNFSSSLKTLLNQTALSGSEQSKKAVLIFWRGEGKIGEGRGEERRGEERRGEERREEKRREEERREEERREENRREENRREEKRREEKRIEEKRREEKRREEKKREEKRREENRTKENLEIRGKPVTLLNSSSSFNLFPPKSVSASYIFIRN